MLKRLLAVSLVASTLAIGGCAAQQEPAPAGPSEEELARAEEAARRAEEAARRAEQASEKSEVIFHKGLQK
jgi:hypothetical protein